MDTTTLRNNPLEFWKLLSIPNPIKGLINPVTHPWHIETLNNFFTENANIVVHPRQIGMNTFQNFLALWTTTTDACQTVRIIDQNPRLQKIETLYCNLKKKVKLPDYVLETNENGTSCMKFSNYSSILFVKDISSRLTYSVDDTLIFNDFAFIKHNLTALYIKNLVPKKIFISSTPSFEENSVFEQLVKDPKHFKVTRYNWRCDLARNEAWALGEIKHRTAKEVNAELYANFPSEMPTLKNLQTTLLSRVE